MSRETLIKLSGRVLVVDDSGDGRMIVSRVLRCIGLQTEEAPDGKVACEKAIGEWKAGRPFDLILMDMHMPVMDGFTATAMLRLKGYKAPIAALSALVGANTRQECLDAGCDDYAAKPIDFESLRDLVQRHLRPAAAEPYLVSRSRTARRADIAPPPDRMVPTHANAEFSAISRIERNDLRPKPISFDAVADKARPLSVRARRVKVAG